MKITSIAALALVIATTLSSSPLMAADDFIFRGQPGLLIRGGTSVPTPPQTSTFAFAAMVPDTVSTSPGIAIQIPLSTEGGQGTVVFSVASADTSLSHALGSSGNVLTLTPSAVGVFPVTIKAVDSANAKEIEKTIQVTSKLAAKPDIQDLPNKFTLATVGENADFVPAVLESGTQNAWTEGGATFSINHDISSFGATFNTSTGSITGKISKPAYLENTTITVTSAAGASDATTPFTLILYPDQPMSIVGTQDETLKTAPSEVLVTPLSTLNALGPVTFDVSKKASGIDVTTDNTASTFTTTSTTVGVYPITIRATDAVGRNAEKSVNVDVSGYFSFAQISIGKYSTCATSAGGGLYCWGTNSPLSPRQKTPVIVAGMESGVSKVSVGYKNICVIKSGALYCVGANTDGQIGDGTATSYTSFVPVNGMSSGVTDIAVINETTGASGDKWHTCAVKSSKVYCWGANNNGQLGLGNTTSRNTPQLVASIPGVATHVAVGSTNGTAFSCAIASGQLYCWGSNNYGQLGVGDKIDRTLPEQVILPSTATDIDNGIFSTCAVSGGSAYCWGNNNYGQIGDGTKTQGSSPKLVAGLGYVTDIELGQYSSCAKSSGQWNCWGGGSGASTGLSGDTLVPKPLAVPGTVRDLATGYGLGCALTDNGGYCWGSNSSYTYGDGTTVSATSPTKVPYY